MFRTKDQSGQGSRDAWICGACAEAKTEESAILLLARNGHHIPRVIGPQVPSS
jgi:hypothetical protein